MAPPAPTPLKPPPLPYSLQMPFLPSPSPQLTHTGFLPSPDAQTTAQQASDVHPSLPCGPGRPAPSASTAAPSPPASSLLTLPSPVFLLHLLSGLTLIFSIPHFFFLFLVPSPAVPLCSRPWIHVCPTYPIFGGLGLPLVACGVFFPNQGLSPQPLHWKHGVLTTELPGRSLTHPITLILFMPVPPHLSPSCFPLCFAVCHGTPLQYSYLENPLDGGAW